MIQNRDKEDLKLCVYGQRESGTYFVATALHIGTQTCLCVILLQHCLVVVAGAP